jgi:flagella basal body P-ring formation protein FlgA
MAITRGQTVTLIAKNAVIEVRAEGKAMTKGAIGDRIKVKNLKTKRIVEGVIINKHLINVNL